MRLISLYGALDPALCDVLALGDRPIAFPLLPTSRPQLAKHGVHSHRISIEAAPRLRVTDERFNGIGDHVEDVLRCPPTEYDAFLPRAIIRRIGRCYPYP